MGVVRRIPKSDTRTRKAIWKDSKRGMTLAEIGEKWGINPTTARSYIIEYNYEHNKRLGLPSWA